MRWETASRKKCQRQTDFAGRNGGRTNKEAGCRRAGIGKCG
jgi:hypothetical protein